MSDRECPGFEFMLVLAMSLSLFLRKKTNILSILLTLCNTNALEREGQARLKQEDGSIFGGWAWGSHLVSQPGCPGQSLTGPGTLSHLQVALGSRGCPACPQGLSPTREAARAGNPARSHAGGSQAAGS